MIFRMHGSREVFLTEEQDMIYSFQKGYWLKGVLVLLIIVLVNGCAALQLSRDPEEGESTQQTQEILVAENQQELEHLVQENANLRESLGRLEQDLK